MGVEVVTSPVASQFTHVATGSQLLSQDSYFHSGTGHRCGNGVLFGIDRRLLVKTKDGEKIIP